MSRRATKNDPKITSTLRKLAPNSCLRGVSEASWRRLETSCGVSLRLVASRRVVSWRLVASRGVSGRFWESWTVLARVGRVHPPDKGESTLEAPPNVSYNLRCVRLCAVCRVPCVVVCCALCVVCFVPGGDQEKHRKAISKTIGKSHVIFKN